MALVILFPNSVSPIGIYDGYDALASTLLGGEVATLTSYGIAGTDAHAKDVEDGYSVTGLNTVRPIVTTTLGGSEVGGMLFLVDEGVKNYGTMFGVVVGGNTGTTVTGGTALGPNTMTASGKVTLWQAPGIYGVTLDALDTTNLNATTSITPGTALSYNGSGKLTVVGSRVGSAINVARFIEFATNGSLVTTPSSLSRLGISGGMKTFKYAAIAWHPVIS